MKFPTPLLAAFSLLAALWSAGPVAADTIFIPRGSAEATPAWRYLDNGSNQGTAWRATAFNDTAWALGRGQFGYGDGDETTAVSPGPSSNLRHVTTYFRRAFTIPTPGPASYSHFKLRLLRDDGAVVYVNGVEVRRDNLPRGAIGYRTLASTNLRAPAESRYFETTLPTTRFATGSNVLAVEVHQVSRGNSDLSFDLELVGVSAPVTSPAILRGPYLQLGTPTSIIVRWRTASATDSTVRYGSDPTLLNLQSDVAGTRTEHEVKLPGLTPATRYYYSVGTSTASLTGGSEFNFITSPVAGSVQPTRVWVLGDPGTGGDGRGRAEAVRDAYSVFAGDRRTDVWLMLGDNAYESGTDTEFTRAVFQTYPNFLRTTPLWSAVGNHEFGTTGAGPYFAQHTFPTTAAEALEVGGVASASEKYYSFDYANIHFVCLDSHSSLRVEAALPANDPPMIAWLKSDLSATLQKWIIAYWHHPPYSKGSHNSDSSSEIETKQMRENAVRILEQHGVDLVLSGHSHSYERSYFIRGHYGPSSTFTPGMKVDGGDGRESGAGAYWKPANGMGPEGAVYAVAGTSGKISNWTTASGSAEFNAFPHPVMFYSVLHLGSAVIDVDGDRLDFQFLSSAGVVDDHFTLLKIAPPAAPTGLVASPGAGVITLSWRASETAASYTLKRAETSAGPFTAVATGLTQNLHTDAGLVDGQTYFYVVSAVNKGGEGVNSDAASATPAPPPPPAAPTGLAASPLSTDSIALTWTDHASDELGFLVERSSDGVTFTHIASLGADTTASTSTGLRPGRTYHYRVRSYGEGGESAVSNVATATTPSAP